MLQRTHSTLRRMVATEPERVLAQAEGLIGQDAGDAEAYRLAALAHRALGQVARAEQAELAAINASAADPQLREAGLALLDNRLAHAEPILRARLKDNPFDVAAIRMLAEVAGRIGRNADAENLLRRALDLAPAFVAARTNLATVLHRQNKTAEALAELERLTVDDPDNLGHTNLRAAIMGRVGEFDEALALYEDVLSRGGARQHKIWMSYGHALKTVGRQADSIAAYRTAVELRPSFGEGWWSLANLKTAKLGDADIAAMERGLTESATGEEDRFHLHFALGKALDDAGRPAEAFDHYAEGNRLRRQQLPYEAAATSDAVDTAITLFDAPFLASRRGWGAAADDPIFILGLPRAGSTLIEQILSSHSAIEGTMELPDIPALINGLGVEWGGLRLLADLSADRLRELGEDYIRRTRIQRREGKPHFIDKLPNNWLHVGFIHMILPNARIVDARRHPLDCGYSNFRQHFARGQAFSYDLVDIGRYYADYVRLMAHFEAVLPGRVHRVIHERLLDNPEAEVRALLAALGLPFEDQCLRFHENSRAVRTASSEQVRRPINRDGKGQWRAVEDRLAPLRQTLGPLTDSYADTALR